MANTLYFAHDPMCSWCWAFRPAWQALAASLPPQVEVRRLLGGLAADSAAPMSQHMQLQLQETWRRIQQRVPGTRFNFAFWTDCRPRRSTYPACRAVIAARNQDPCREEPMVLAIQQAYYLQARNPADTATLAELAAEIDLDSARFLQDLQASETDRQLQYEIAQCRALRLTSFPSLALEAGSSRWPLPVDYRDPGAMLGPIELLSV